MADDAVTVVHPVGPADGLAAEPVLGDQLGIDPVADGPLLVDAAGDEIDLLVVVLAEGVVEVAEPGHVLDPDRSGLGIPSSPGARAATWSCTGST